MELNPHIIVAGLFFFLVIYNAEHRMVALAALAVAITAVCTLLKYLPDWAPLATIPFFLIVNCVDYVRNQSRTSRYARRRYKRY